VSFCIETFFIFLDFTNFYSLGSKNIYGMWSNWKVSKTKVSFIVLSSLAVLKAQLHNPLEASRNFQCVGYAERRFRSKQICGKSQTISYK